MSIVIKIDTTGTGSNYVISRHEEGSLGTATLFDASSSTSFVDSEDRSSDFLSGPPTSLVVNRPPTTGTIAGTTSIVINGTLLVEGVDYDISGTDTIDFSLGTSPYASNLNIGDKVFISYETDPVSFSWVLLDSPTNSSASIVGSSSSSTITVDPLDREGSYLVQVIIDSGIPESEDSLTAIVSVNTLKKDYSIPAAGESDEFDNLKGWQKKLEIALKGFSTEGSFNTLTLGDAEGADYTSFSDLVSDLSADKFGLGVPNSSSGIYYIVNLIAPLYEDITIPDGVILNGNLNHIYGSSSSATPVSLTGRSAIVNAILPSNNLNGTTAISTSSSSTEEAVISNIRVGSSYTSGIDVTGPAIISEVSDYDNPLSGTDLSVSVGSSDNPVVVKDCIVKDVSLSGTGTALVKSTSITGDLSIVDGTTTVEDVTVHGNISISEVSGVTRVDLRQSSTTGNTSVDSSVTGGDLNLYGYARKGPLINNGAIIVNYYNPANPSPPFSRDYITPGAATAPVDINLTNVSYVNNSPGNSPDIQNILVYADGLLLVNSDDPNAAAGIADVRPDPAGSPLRIQLLFDTYSDTVIQVIKNA